MSHVGYESLVVEQREGGEGAGGTPSPLSLSLHYTHQGLVPHPAPEKAFYNFRFRTQKGTIPGKEIINNVIHAKRREMMNSRLLSALPLQIPLLQLLHLL